MSRRRWYEKAAPAYPWEKRKRPNRLRMLVLVKELHGKLFKRCLFVTKWPAIEWGKGRYGGAVRSGQRHSLNCCCHECCTYDLNFIELQEYRLRGGDYWLNCGKDEHEKGDTCCQKEQLHPMTLKESKHRILLALAKKWKIKFPTKWESFAGL